MPTLKIDGIQVSVPEGATILDAARKCGVRIPTLCYLEGLSPMGACRVCMV
ncbi:MAG: 2Fe-2S iron-sulfur cluster-binding protein [Planctomycetota bacterium]|nr:2Fe-2S iron-sulfur cluster-binding protein [Planctomycetota bacterium]